MLESVNVITNGGVYVVVFKLFELLFSHISVSCMAHIINVLIFVK